MSGITLPLVTCIMPTCDRRRFVPHAIECFLRQDYPNRELLVVDDGAMDVIDVIPPDSRIRYVRLPHRLPIGTKRNAACDLAAGEVILHWDDDDWSADWRVRYQTEALLETQHDVCGLDHVMFYDPAADRGWRYVYPPGGRPWVYGATLCYTRAFWRANPFPDVRVGEDTRFVWSLRAERVRALVNRGFYVGTIHPGNTSPKQTGDHRWRSCDVADVAAAVGARWDRYRSAAKGTH